MTVDYKNFFTLKEFRLHYMKFKWFDKEAELMKENKSWEIKFAIGTDEDLFAGEVYRVLEKDGSETHYLIEYEVLEGSPKAGSNCRVKCIPRGRVKLNEEVKDKPGYFTIHRNIKKL